jgi:RNA-directed DNA polymerase
VKPPGPPQRAEPSPARDEGKPDAGALWEAIWEKGNLTAALKRVERNKGAPGVDGVSTEELRAYLKIHWPGIRSSLESGRYKPQPVRRVEIPKPDGGVRLLGIPTVVDRLIQQAIAQALTPMFEEVFSPHSYGFRPGRSAHDAVRQAQTYIREGYEWVVDIDLEKYFDGVNHDMLMARVARTVKDKKVLKLIRAYLESGVMVNGVVMDTEEGTPQGGPLSPLLANIMLDDLDKELEKRGHCFVRYADDCNIYARTPRAGERVMSSVRRFLEKKLKLRVNEKKSKVDKVSKVKFLGFSFYIRGVQVLIRVAEKALEKCRKKLRMLTRRCRQGKLEDIAKELMVYLRGWMQYFSFADTPRPFRDMNGWLRRRLRQLIWKRWKRGTTRFGMLVRLGIRRDHAALGAYGKSPWRMAHSSIVEAALCGAFFDRIGFPDLPSLYVSSRYSLRTAGCGPACPVV